MNTQVKIYVLCDPATCKIRYIGRTKCELGKRRKEHISKVKHYTKYFPNVTPSHKVNWINSLTKRGIKPQIRLLTIINGWKESHIEERRLINKYKEKFNLVNSEDRGEGYKNKSVSTETRQKIKEKLTEYYSKEENKTNFYNAIFCYDLTGEFVKEYKSTTFAASALQIPILHITNMLNCFDNKRGKRKAKYGYYFSKHKYPVFPFTAEKQESEAWVEVAVRHKISKVENLFVNLRSFAKMFDLTEWDIAMIKKAPTKRIKKLLLEYDIMLDNVLLPS